MTRLTQPIIPVEYGVDLEESTDWVKFPQAPFSFVEGADKDSNNPATFYPHKLIKCS